ncbi:prepilin-type N-terminal cleavage/methylation domain-containing protein [Saccharospirillum impatiens]|uniref:prepilin-type N-terminal cleavage/methylation domain-containing protein n=1 Tax=Saccharospirillum impatiens TaxID=169438 RepID=UPI00048BED66
MERSCNNARRAVGFTLVELVLVIVILGVLVAVALPRFVSLSSSARTATVESVAGAMNSTVGIVRSKAYVSGLSPAATNPGGSQQSDFVIETEVGRSEVDWRNLCPESRAEVADALTMLNYISLQASSAGLKTTVDNRYTRVGFTLPTDPGLGCYVEYDSFGFPECTVTTFLSGC